MYTVDNTAASLVLLFADNRTFSTFISLRWIFASGICYLPDNSSIGTSTIRLRVAGETHDIPVTCVPGWVTLLPPLATLAISIMYQQVCTISVLLPNLSFCWKACLSGLGRETGKHDECRTKQMTILTASATRSNTKQHACHDRGIARSTFWRK